MAEGAAETAFVPRPERWGGGGGEEVAEDDMQEDRQKRSANT